MTVSKKINIFLILNVLLIFIYTLYRDLIYFNNEKNYNLIYLIYFIVIFFLIGTLFLKDEIRKNLITSIISLIITLYFIELFIFFNLKIKLSKYLQDGFDKRTRYEVFTDIRKTNPNIYPAVFPSNFIYNQISDKSPIVPFGNISGKEILWCNENGYYSIFKSDRYGFRNPNDKIWEKKLINYILIGDSYTEGACVNTKDTISGKLSLISNKDTLNLGRGGNGPLSKLAILYEFSKISEGTNLLWFYYEGNDIKDMMEERNSEILNKYYENKNYRQNLKSNQKLIDQLLINYSEEKIKTKKKEVDHALKEYSPLKILGLYNVRFNLKEFIITRLLKKKKKFENKELIFFESIINKANKFTLEKKGNFYFVYLPNYNRYIFKSPNNYMSKDDILKILNKNKIKVIDIDELVFKKEEDKLSLFPLRKSGHYNEIGYEKVSRAIVDYLKK